MRFTPYDPAFVAHIRAGGPDAHGHSAERAICDGDGNPCRSCLRDIAAGEAMLILAAKPFDGTHPYAEVGPIFLHTDACTPWDGAGLPPILTTSPDYLIKGYGPDERIVYGTGAVIAAADLMDEVARRLDDRRVAFVDVRSARNNCFQTRARADGAIG